MIKLPTATTKPKREIQIRDEACLRSSGLPEEPIYWMPEIKKLMMAKSKETKIEILRILLKRLIKAPGSEP